MRFILLLFLVSFVPLAATKAQAQTQNDRYIQMAEHWLGTLKNASARFEQIDYQGRSLRGIFHIARPGKLRFDYDAPIRDHIVADGFMIYFYDGETDQFSSAPIGSTLADFILRDDVRMDGRVTVDSVRRKDNMVHITLSQTDQPGTGQLVMHFSVQPFALKSWRIIDAQGLTTDIILSRFDRAVSHDPSLFVFKNAQSQDRFNQ